MSLINCPECNKQISNQANACPNCGFPLRDLQINKESKYDVTLIKVDFKHQNHIFVHDFLIKSKNISSKDAFNNIIQNTPYTIFINISLTNAQKIKEMLSRYNCIVEIEKSTDYSLPSDEKIVNDYFIKNVQPKCPHCSSTNLHNISTTSKLIHGVAFGLFSKTARSQFECLNCGYKW